MDDSRVVIQVRQQIDGEWHTKSHTIRYHGNHLEVMSRIQHLFQQLTENKVLGEVTIKHKITRR